MDEERQDGFRKRRTRPKGWLEKAIKRGEVRDPNAPPEPEPAPRDDAHVIHVPVATLDTEG